MAEVGVLEIKIESNATAAAGGLTKLANRLEQAGQAASSFDLSNVATQIENIVKSVGGQNKAVSSVGSFINAVAGYYKTIGKISEVKINTAPRGDQESGWRRYQAGQRRFTACTVAECSWRKLEFGECNSRCQCVADYR